MKEVDDAAVPVIGRAHGSPRSRRSPSDRATVAPAGRSWARVHEETGSPRTSRARSHPAHAAKEHAMAIRYRPPRLNVMHRGRPLAVLAGFLILIGVFTMITSAQPSTQTATKPTIVLVHGAFADASSWNGVVERLQRDGYTVV